MVEALVALTLLTVGLIPAFVQASAALALTSQVRNSLIAANLAQEGVEIVRSIRDANWFSGKPFDQDLAGGPYGCDSGCLVDYSSAVPIARGTNPPLKLDPSSGLYQYGSGTDTQFTRTITITEPSAHEMKVITLVSWQERSGLKSLTVEYHLYDWLQ